MCVLLQRRGLARGPFTPQVLLTLIPGSRHSVGSCTNRAWQTTGEMVFSHGTLPGGGGIPQTVFLISLWSIWRALEPGMEQEGQEKSRFPVRVGHPCVRAAPTSCENSTAIRGSVWRRETQRPGGNKNLKAAAHGIGELLGSNSHMPDCARKTLWLHLLG